MTNSKVHTTQFLLFLPDTDFHSALSIVGRVTLVKTYHKNYHLLYTILRSLLLLLTRGLAPCWRSTVYQEQLKDNKAKYQVVTHLPCGILYSSDCAPRVLSNMLFAGNDSSIGAEMRIPHTWHFCCSSTWSVDRPYRRYWRVWRDLFWH